MAEPIPIKLDTEKDKLPNGLIADTLVNLITGMNTMNDPHTANHFHLGTIIDRSQADAMYLGDWLGAKVIDSYPEDMLREWRTIEGIEGDDLEAFESFSRDIRVKENLSQALKWERLYGGAGIILGIDGAGEMHEPLDMERIRPNSLRYISTLDRWHLIPSTLDTYNPLRPNWNRPEFYRAFTGPDLIHRSRILFFRGIELPYHLSIRNQYWGGSVLDRVLTAIENATTAQHGIAQLIVEAKVDVFKLPGLLQQLQTPEGTELVMTRIALANQGKSINNAVILDASEEWEQKQSVLSQGLSSILNTFVEIVAGAADIPISILLGKQAGGLGETGQEDTRHYYDNVKKFQEDRLQHPLRKLDEVILRSLFGEVPSDFSSEFDSLWQQSEPERSEVQARDVTRDIELLHEGIIEPHHIASRLLEMNIYPTMDESWVRELEAVLDPLEERSPFARTEPEEDPEEDPEADPEADE